MSFDPVHVLTNNQSEADRYMVAVGIVTDGERVLGIFYGAGASKGLAENRIFAKWLQKRVVFETAAGTLSEGALGLGPDALLLPASEEATGRFLVYAEDGVTLLHAGDEVTVRPGDVWQIGQD